MGLLVLLDLLVRRSVRRHRSGGFPFRQIPLGGGRLFFGGSRRSIPCRLFDRARFLVHRRRGCSHIVRFVRSRCRILCGLVNRDICLRLFDDGGARLVDRSIGRFDHWFFRSRLCRGYFRRFGGMVGILRRLLLNRRTMFVRFRCRFLGDRDRLAFASRFGLRFRLGNDFLDRLLDGYGFGRILHHFRLFERGQGLGIFAVDFGDRVFEFRQLAIDHVVRRTRVHVFELAAHGRARLLVYPVPHFGCVFRQAVNGPANNCNKIRH